MKFLRNNKENFLMFTLGFLALGFGLVACKKDDSADAKNVKIINAGVLPGAAQNISIGIARIEAKHGSPVDVAKLDFSWPEEIGYGENPEFEIYNPAGGQVQPITDLRSIKYWNDYTDFPRYIITLGNKVNNIGTEKSELIAILPKVTEIACKVTMAYAQEGVSSRDIIIPKINKLNVTPHPQEVPDNEVVNLPSRSGCVETSGGLYYYHLLVER